MLPAARRVIPSGTSVGLNVGSVKNNPLPMPMKIVMFGVAALASPEDSDTRSSMPSSFRSTNSFSASSPLPGAPCSATTMSVCGFWVQVVLLKTSVKQLNEKWPTSAATGFENPPRADHVPGAGRKVPEVSPVSNDSDPSPLLTTTMSFTGASQSAGVVQTACFFGPAAHVPMPNRRVHVESSHRSPMPLPSSSLWLLLGVQGQLSIFFGVVVENWS